MIRRLSLGLVALLHGPVQAQVVDVPAPPAVPDTAVAGSGLGVPSPLRALRWSPRLALTETLTDNVALATTNRHAESITQLVAGVQGFSNAGRVRGFVDYALTGIFYARGSASNALQNRLNAAGTAELIERRAFVDVNGSIGQQSVSAFGTQSVDPALANSNRTEVRTLRVAPYLRGRVARLADYELRVGRTATRNGTAAASDLDVTDASARLTGDPSGRWITWNADASRLVTDYRSGRRTELDRTLATLVFVPDPQLRLSLFGGREWNDFASFEKTAHAVYGARANWSPTPRTVVVAERQRRFFGDAHTLTVSHRLARSAFFYSDTRDILVNNGTAPLTQSAAFDALFNNPVIVAQLPDPAARRTFVDNQLRSGASGFLTSAVTLQRSRQLSYSLFGARDTLVVQALRTDSERLDTASGATDDFSRVGRIRQQVVSANLSHRLTSVSTLTGVLSQQRTSGEVRGTGAAPSSTLRSAILGWSSRVNQRTAVSLSARHMRLESSTAASYRESAAIATVSLQF